MKLIIAIARPFKLDEVRQALGRIGVQGMAEGYGRQKGHTEIYRGAEYTVDLLLKVQIEIVVDDPRAERGSEAICRAAKSGRIGDGKISVSTIDQAVRIRTGELDANAP